jgi:plasmid stabilization system protein ParE
MIYRLLVSEPAENDIEAAYRWWRENRSADQAARWYVGIRKVIAELCSAADRHPQAPEHDLHPIGLRQALFGLGSRATHRIVYTVDDDLVTVVRVRHASQDALTSDEFG